MFTQRSLIRKNSKELQDKLHKLGYDICGCCNYDDSMWLNTDRDSVHGIGYNYGKIDLNGYDTVDKRLNLFLENNENSENKAIDCGKNEDLFLAIAALRYDSDYMQYFVCDEDYITYSMNEHKKGEFILFDGVKAHINKAKPFWHKATVQELIEHFNSK